MVLDDLLLWFIHAQVQEEVELLTRYRKVDSCKNSYLASGFWSGLTGKELLYNVTKIRYRHTRYCKWDGGRRNEGKRLMCEKIWSARKPLNDMKN